MKQLTKAEEELMQIIWELGPCTVAAMRDHIAAQQGQEKPPHSTVSTIVIILEKKGFVGHKAYGRTYEYFPLISKDQYGKQSLNKLVNDYFAGSTRDLVSFLVKEKNLGIKDLSDLMEVLDSEE
ncbi:MAG: BlaI/MecI/CopY family transcriptional regulator [Haliscomenobacter sp.]|uniref:BlaI/MecI/CopY family transcriptional regulator n=1 Tax=Haliscomenobacter sp. TaxID=2717303 RepID=UPI0029A10CD2|nr:BlaI/MecI/CopY family transcriptional regulator [Haliscomenobacter sp.]MDX2069983.1 BlaI/MecI/CopY family transcriptional regulator [Haliscomenobacter sp.]